MFEKSLAAAALAVLAVFAVPAAANAAGYVPHRNISVTGTTAPGGTVAVNFTAGSFASGEDVSFALTGMNEVGATLASVRSAVNAQSLAQTVGDSGAVTLTVALPTDASGTYTTTATGLTSGTIGTASLTVSDSDAAMATDGGIASVGNSAPMLVIWGAAGAFLLGVALVVVLRVVRRHRKSA